jgi:hypothetical protein
MALLASVPILLQKLSAMNIFVAILARGMLDLERRCKRSFPASHMTLLAPHRCMTANELELGEIMIERLVLR